MKRICGVGQFTLVSIAVILSLLTLGVAAAWAESSPWLCVPETAGKTVTSGGTGTEAKCESKEEVKNLSYQLPPGAEWITLSNILKHMKYEASGIDGKPTIKIEGVNVQIVNGEGKTATINGEGNLVIGYDENAGKHEQTGSHDLILGGEQTYTSYGRILAGYLSSATAPFSSVTGGEDNTASGEYASVTAGRENIASGKASSITGGIKSKAEAYAATVSGGASNVASGERSLVGGGNKNTASANWTVAIGGEKNEATTVERATVIGGFENKASGDDSLVDGGLANIASGESGVVSGGRENDAEGKFSSVFGSKLLTATKEYESLL